jgi:SPP1 gp7 family putative phage head morphogenesis protein
VNARAERLTAMIRARRAMGVKAPRRRPPKARPPTTIEREYMRAIRARMTPPVERLLAELAGELPPLLEVLARERLGERGDAGEPRRIREIVDRATQRMVRDFKPEEVEELARIYAQRTSSHQRLQVLAETRAVLGVDPFLADAGLRDIVDAFIAENVTLIKDILPATAARVEKAVTRAASNGTLWPTLAKELRDNVGYPEKRAKAIARDQIGKIYGQITRSRHQELGLTEYIWQTVNDDRVRDEHKERQGKRFKYSDPPEDGHPGEAINCRCYPEPVYDTILANL